ncbi:protein phosphatase 2C [Fructobacillus tropaeoli]|uniref:Protein phosphatase 2C n=1 Tax=Fructobacillus tropaeoli TaxID=709323 RepID=A0A3F3H295_9LACO|nr:protein phosphatase 2C [Fructobacillus tropaeoli]
MTSLKGLKTSCLSSQISGFFFAFLDNKKAATEVATLIVARERIELSIPP